MDDAARLKSINWTTGMLLSPEHFRRQDAYFDEMLGWLLRYCLPGVGLVGGGIRVAVGERGLGKFDPRVEVHDDGYTVRVSILEARGITPLGQLVDIGEGNTIRFDVQKSALAGLTDLLIFVAHTGAREEDPTSVGRDPANPTQPAYRRAAYEIKLGIEADTVPRSLCVGRLRRANESLGFELDSRFIPACSTMLGHSSLYAAWQRTHAEVLALSQHYSELHRQVAQFAEYVARRGVDPRHDRDILAFVERAVMALDHCAYETADPSITPDDFFREIERAGRRIALGLDLSESSRLYFADLGQADASYGALLEEERELLVRPRDVEQVLDLAVAVTRADTTLGRLRRLVEALEARYIDYRINRSVESLRFLLDGDGEQFFVSVATPGHPQRDLETLTFVFGQLSLAARQRYRLVFLGERDAAPWQPGDLFRADIRINPAQNDSRPLSREVVCVLPGQRNFAVDFEPGDDIASLAGLQVTVQPGTRIRGCILYQRRLGVSGSGVGAAVMSAPLPTPKVMPAAEPRSAPAAASYGTPTPMSSPAAPEDPNAGAVKKPIKVTIKPGPSSGSGS
jgi:hypothetical protein